MSDTILAAVIGALSAVVGMWVKDDLDKQAENKGLILRTYKCLIVNTLSYKRFITAFHRYDLASFNNMLLTGEYAGHEDKKAIFELHRDAANSYQEKCHIFGAKIDEAISLIEESVFQISVVDQLDEATLNTVKELVNTILGYRLNKNYQERLKTGSDSYSTLEAEQDKDIKASLTEPINALIELCLSRMRVIRQATRLPV